MNVQQVWQAQSTEAPRISLAYVRHRAGSVERRTRLRNALEYGGGVLALVFFGYTAYQHSLSRPLMLAGLGCSALWALYYMYRWHGLAATQATPAEAGVLDTLRYQRRQLERQRDARRGSWRWAVPPMLPGYALIVASMIVELDPVPWWAVTVSMAWLFVGSAIAVAYFEYEARRLQREIDALDSLAAGP